MRVETINQRILDGMWVDGVDGLGGGRDCDLALWEDIREKDGMGAYIGDVDGSTIHIPYLPHALSNETTKCDNITNLVISTIHQFFTR